MAQYCRFAWSFILTDTEKLNVCIWYLDVAIAYKPSSIVVDDEQGVCKSLNLSIGDWFLNGKFKLLLLLVRWILARIFTGTSSILHLASRDDVLEPYSLPNPSKSRRSSYRSGMHFPRSVYSFAQAARMTFWPTRTARYATNDAAQFQYVPSHRTLSFSSPLGIYAYTHNRSSSRAPWITYALQLPKHISALVDCLTACCGWERTMQIGQIVENIVRFGRLFWLKISALVNEGDITVEIEDDPVHPCPWMHMCSWTQFEVPFGILELFEFIGDMDQCISLLASDSRWPTFRDIIVNSIELQCGFHQNSVEIDRNHSILRISHRNSQCRTSFDSSSMSSAQCQPF